MGLACGYAGKDAPDARIHMGVGGSTEAQSQTLLRVGALSMNAWAPWVLFGMFGNRCTFSCFPVACRAYCYC